MTELIFLCQQSGNGSGFSKAQTGQSGPLPLLSELEQFKVKRVYSSSIFEYEKAAERISSHLNCEKSITESLNTEDTVWGEESLISIQRRVVEFAEGVCSGSEGSFLVVSPVIPIKLLVVWICGMPIDLVFRLRVDSGSMSVLRFFEFSAELRCLNVHPEVISP
ncbi:hypothetical protein CHISP_2862 [Chitinispirillum alkaliphilum]|nr:hypothetical protein CHISP_2862 [Chitinispirillum alkaliphilum]